LVWGYIVWGAMGVVVALPELLSATADVGFPTISGTVGYLEYWHPEFALLLEHSSAGRSSSCSVRASALEECAR
jgi:hypothetical protein